VTLISRTRDVIKCYVRINKVGRHVDPPPGYVTVGTSRLVPVPVVVAKSELDDPVGRCSDEVGTQPVCVDFGCKCLPPTKTCWNKIVSPGPFKQPLSAHLHCSRDSHQTGHQAA
jgi:hypothetical protein